MEDYLLDYALDDIVLTRRGLVLKKPLLEKRKLEAQAKINNSKSYLDCALDDVVLTRRGIVLKKPLLEKKKVKRQPKSKHSRDTRRKVFYNKNILRVSIKNDQYDDSF